MTHIDIDDSLIAKMNQNHIRDFSDAELQRVFASVVSPTCCIRATKKLLAADLIRLNSDKVVTK